MTPSAPQLGAKAWTIPCAPPVYQMPGTNRFVRLSRRYRRDMNAARARLAAFERHVIATPWGQVECAEQGQRDPVLVPRGSFTTASADCLKYAIFLPVGRVIAPSRFGYLGSSMPPNATPAAQADAFAALLDRLGIDQIDVIGCSAGATSALQLALRHPGRMKHLAIVVGNLPGSPTAVVQPPSAKFQRQFVMWALRTFAPSTTIRNGRRGPERVRMTSEDARYVNEFIDSLFPVSNDGFIFDAFVSNADVNGYNLEAISVPTLIAHTKGQRANCEDHFTVDHWHLGCRRCLTARLELHLILLARGQN